MGLETATYIDDFVITNPQGTDAKSAGDDHLRLLKSVLKSTFPGADRAFGLKGGIGLSATSELTIASGSITPTGGLHSVDTESDAATDDLDNIATTNFEDGAFLLIKANNDARTVVVKHQSGGAGQIHLNNAADFSMDNDKKLIILRREGADWYEVVRDYGGDFAALRTDFGLATVDIQEFTADGTWTKPAGVEWVTVTMYGPGGGGGGGNSGGGRGGAGGGGGGYNFAVMRADDLPATVAVTCPAGGAGGAADSDGSIAADWTKFGDFLTAYRGGGGEGGSSLGAGGGGSGGSLSSGGTGSGGGDAGSAGTGTYAGVAGGSTATTNDVGVTNDFSGGSGAGVFTGGGSPAADPGGSSRVGPGGGGAGGPATPGAGAAGGDTNSNSAGGGGTAGTSGGGAGGNGAAGSSAGGGQGGGGGGGNNAGNGGAGGDGGAGGGGGGGGGAGSGTGGAGGAGGVGRVTVTSF